MNTRCLPVGDTVLGRCPKCGEPTVDCYESADENSEAEAWMGDRKAQIDCECYTCGHLWFIHAEAIDA